jgi:predicted HD superfamily hydrolase involved in NAD metabolism
VETPEGPYTFEQSLEIERLEHDLVDRMGDVNPKRLAHSLSVARTAEELAITYGVDPYLARVAGILHDWDKVVPPEELLDRARRLDIDFGVDLTLVEPLLHGVVAARELPDVYPELPCEVFRAIERHTTGACDMSALDAVIFVADGIEPLRTGTIGIQETRDMVGKASLDELFWNSFVGGISYVLDTRRYLYPGTIEIYNELVLRRSGR